MSRSCCRRGRPRPRPPRTRPRRRPARATAPTQLTDKNRVTRTDEALFIAGADRLNPRTLDRLLALADTRRLRVVLMFARLRDQALSALGASDTCVFMRLSDYREATHAAEQVGRDHTFVLSTTTHTRGSAYDQGTNRGTSHERGSSTSSTFGAQFSASRSQSVGESASQGSSNSQNISVSDSESYQRVYEFALEPRTVQGLPETALFLVEQAHGTATHRRLRPHHRLTPQARLTPTAAPVGDSLREGRPRSFGASMRHWSRPQAQVPASHFAQKVAACPPPRHLLRKPRVRARRPPSLREPAARAS